MKKQQGDKSRKIDARRPKSLAGQSRPKWQEAGTVRHRFAHGGPTLSILYFDREGKDCDRDGKESPMTTPFFSPPQGMAVVEARCFVCVWISWR
jgi:hypothetical protein